MLEASYCFNFLDKDKNSLPYTATTVEELLSSFASNYQNSRYVEVRETVSPKTYDFLYYHFGFDLPTEKGLWKYVHSGEYLRIG